MNWTPGAETAIKKVPFFVRKKVRRRVENDALAAGKSKVSLADVKATQKRYLSRMASEIKGYQIDACFGPSGCPNRAAQAEVLVEKIEGCLKAADLLTFLKQQVGEGLKFHHEFRVTVAECPNACSQPQIKDIGIIGARRPAITTESCTGCGDCVAICPDEAIELTATDGQPVVDACKCLVCGKCIAACPSGTIAEDQHGYKVLLGGKLGRHPRLATELPGIYSEQAVLRIVQACIDLYKTRSRNGQRFAELLHAADFEKLATQFGRELNPNPKENPPC